MKKMREFLGLQWDQTIQSQRKSTLNFHWKDWCWSFGTLATWCEELTHWKRSWCWEKLRAGGEGEVRGWEGWMASQTQWTWVWVNSGTWWWTRRHPSCGSWHCRVGHDWVTDLSWIEPSSGAYRLYDRANSNLHEDLHQDTTLRTGAASASVPVAGHCQPTPLQENPQTLTG